MRLPSHFPSPSSCESVQRTDGRYVSVANLCWGGGAASQLPQDHLSFHEIPRWGSLITGEFPRRRINRGERASAPFSFPSFTRPPVALWKNGDFPSLDPVSGRVKCWEWARTMERFPGVPLHINPAASPGSNLISVYIGMREGRNELHRNGKTEFPKVCSLSPDGCSGYLRLSDSRDHCHLLGIAPGAILYFGRTRSLLLRKPRKLPPMPRPGSSCVYFFLSFKELFSGLHGWIFVPEIVEGWDGGGGVGGVREGRRAEG